MSDLSPACRAFRDTMKKLAFVDRADVPAFDPKLFSAASRWSLFRTYPHTYFLCCPDEIAGQIWAAMGMETTDNKGEG